MRFRAPTAFTGQSLYYLGEGDLAHRVLAIAEEGAERAAYALKLLQSEGELSIASTGKGPATGRLITHEYRVAGPVATLTTTAADIDDDDDQGLTPNRRARNRPVPNVTARA